MKISIALRIASLAIAALLASLTTLSDQKCPKCDCSHFPISDPDCAKCCFSQKGTVISLSPTALTVEPVLAKKEQPVKTFEIKTSTKLNGNLKEGTTATIYYHIVDDRNVATRIDGSDFLHGLLIPANLPSPPDICEALEAHFAQRAGRAARQIPKDAMRIFFGPSEAYSTSQRLVVWKIANHDILVLQKTEKGISVSAELRGPDGQLIAEIVDNDFFINLRDSFRIQGAGTPFLKVSNDKGERILEIDFINSNVIKILGTFFGPNGEKIALSESEAAFSSPSGTSFSSHGDCLGGSDQGTIEMNADGSMYIR